MTKREKRLEKGIESLEKQIALHEEKKKQAEELEQEELTAYYDKEIKALQNRKENREEILDKQ